MFTPFVLLLLSQSIVTQITHKNPRDEGTFQSLHLHHTIQLTMFAQIAIEGCCHGELDAIYTHIASLEQQYDYNVDLLLICGDFQAIRNLRDLECLAVPDKYKRLGGFAK